MDGRMVTKDIHMKASNVPKFICTIEVSGQVGIQVRY